MMNLTNDLEPNGVESRGSAKEEVVRVGSRIWKEASCTPVFKILGTAGEMNPLISCWCIGIRRVNAHFSIGSGEREVYIPVRNRCPAMPDPHPTLVTKHLCYLIAAVDGLATALASHLVVRSSADATLTHVVYVYSSVIVERHVDLV